MRRPAVGLDDHALVGPAEVRHRAVVARVDGGRRQAGVADEPAEAALELRAGRHGIGRQGVELLLGDEAADERLGARGLERLGGEIGREVGERPQRRGHGQAVDLRHRRRVGCHADAEPGARSRALAGHGHFDGVRHDGDHPLQSGGRSVARHGGRAGREQGCPHPSDVGQGGMPDGVDAAEHGVQSAGLEPVADLPRRHPELRQLSAAHDAVLPPGESGESDINADRSRRGAVRPALWLLCDINAGRARFRAV